MKTLRVCFGAAGLIALTGAPLVGQASVDFAGGSNWLVGYVANAPHQLVGFGTALVLPAFRGWGLYADVKLSLDSPGNDRFLLPHSPNEAENLGDLYFRERSAWTTVNLAALRTISREMALYVGGGLSQRGSYLQYLDETLERGNFGHYWVEDVQESRNHANLIAGMFFRMGNRLVFQFGGETAPAGFTAGGHLLVR